MQGRNPRFAVLKVTLAANGIAVEFIVDVANEAELYKPFVAWFPITVEGVLLLFVLHVIPPAFCMSFQILSCRRADDSAVAWNAHLKVKRRALP